VTSVLLAKRLREHLVNLEGVFQALRHHGLRIKPTKCAFAMKEVKLLGHKVFNKSMQPEEHKVKPIHA
jgi:hypothetical protein